MAAIFVAGVNLFFPENPGFESLCFFPYVVMPPVVALFSGPVLGAAVLGGEVFLLVFPLPLILTLIHPETVSWAAWFSALGPALYWLPVVVILTYVASMGGSRGRAADKTVRQRLRDLVQENHRLKKLSRAQAEVSRELEERVYRQMEGITRVYESLHKMHMVDLEGALKILMETVHSFTGATAMSLWRLAPSGQELHFVRNGDGKPQEMGFDPISLENSLEGWVVRNNRHFSIRMVNEYENLRRMEEGRSILIYPIRIGEKPWGILNIEEMPFYKYNIYTEQVLDIVLNLSESALLQVIDTASLVDQSEVDPLSGLPRFASLDALMEKRLSRLRKGGNPFSVVILEIQNLEEIKNSSPHGEVSPGFAEPLKMISTLRNGKVEIMHYRDEGQWAMFLPQMDQDGVSLFCLELLEKISTTPLSFGGSEITLDIILGFATCHSPEEADSLWDRAENMLGFQKELGG
jgi:GGDEF domain-containing protein